MAPTAHVWLASTDALLRLNVLGEPMLQAAIIREHAIGANRRAEGPDTPISAARPPAAPRRPETA